MNAPRQSKTAPRIRAEPFFVVFCATLTRQRADYIEPGFFIILGATVRL